jgi:hypothetical protein
MPYSQPPTAESVFGPNPWNLYAIGWMPDGSMFRYNPRYFATDAAAAILAKMLGGKVVATGQIGVGPFYQNIPMLVIEFANGGQTNAGMLIDGWNHGMSQSEIDQGIANSVLSVFPEWKPVPSSVPAPPPPVIPDLPKPYVAPDDNTPPPGQVGTKANASATDGFPIGYEATRDDGSVWRKSMARTPFGTAYWWECVKAAN